MKGNSIRESNVRIFEDTCSIIDGSNDLKNQIVNSNKTQEIILEGTEVTCNKSRITAPCKIYVTKNSSFDAARDYDGSGKTCVLNFASATTPGGGVTKGSSAQEECLCRCSTLYKSLNEQVCWDKFYNPHRNGLDALHNDDIIYTPGVTIIKRDNYEPLDESDRVVVDVLTCAAPNLREDPKNAYNAESSGKIEISDDDLYALHCKRAKKILEVAASKNVDNIILGAFGCGAFRNDPEVVAKAYKDSIKEFRHAFKTIEFAVYCRPDDDTNYRVFKKVILDE